MPKPLRYENKCWDPFKKHRRTITKDTVKIPANILEQCHESCNFTNKTWLCKSCQKLIRADIKRNGVFRIHDNPPAAQPEDEQMQEEEAAAQPEDVQMEEEEAAAQPDDVQIQREGGSHGREQSGH